MRTLTAFVHLVDDQGRLRSFGPADVVPEWAAEQITNPKAWTDRAAEAEEATAASPAAPETPVEEPGESPAGDGEHAAEDEPQAGPPPKAGPGSSREAWAAYADANGFEVDPEDGRDEIIAGLDEAGISTDRAVEAEEA